MSANILVVNLAVLVTVLEIAANLYISDVT
jgi:hypothetical protein